MKSILFAVLLACATILSARADIPPLRPTRFTVSNLAAFPKYQFTFTASTVFGDDQSKTQPLQNGKTYEITGPVELQVQETGARPRVWATLEYSPRGRTVKISVKDVRRTEKGLEVSYDIDDPTAPKKGTTSTGEAWPRFILAGLGCCGLVLLARRPSKSAN
jgi:hypothetical protein